MGFPQQPATHEADANPVAKYYVIAVFLTNVRSCFYGGQIANYFGAAPLSIDEYFALVVD